MTTRLVATEDLSDKTISLYRGESETDLFYNVTVLKDDNKKITTYFKPEKIVEKDENGNLVVKWQASVKLSEVIEAEDLTTRLEFNPSGLITSRVHTRPDGEMTIYEYNNNGESVKVHGSLSKGLGTFEGSCYPNGIIKEKHITFADGSKRVIFYNETGLATHFKGVTVEGYDYRGTYWPTSENNVKDKIIQKPEGEVRYTFRQDGTKATYSFTPAEGINKPKVFISLDQSEKRIRKDIEYLSGDKRTYFFNENNVEIRFEGSSPDGCTYEGDCDPITGRLKEKRLHFVSGEEQTVFYDEQGFPATFEGVLPNGSGKYVGTCQPGKSEFLIATKTTWLTLGEIRNDYYNEQGIRIRVTGKLADNKGTYEASCHPNGYIACKVTKFSSGDERIEYFDDKNNRLSLRGIMLGKGTYNGTCYPNGNLKEMNYLFYSGNKKTDYYDEKGFRTHFKGYSVEKCAHYEGEYYPDNQIRMSKYFFKKGGVLELYSNKKGVKILSRYTFVCGRGSDIKLFYPDGSVRRHIVNHPSGDKEVLYYNKKGIVTHSTKYTVDDGSYVDTKYYPNGLKKFRVTTYPTGRTKIERFNEKGVRVSCEGKLPNNKGTYTCVIGETGMEVERRSTYYDGGYEYFVYNQNHILTYAEGTLSNKLGKFKYTRKKMAGETVYTYNTGEEKILLQRRDSLYIEFKGYLPNGSGIYCGTYWPTGALRSLSLRLNDNVMYFYYDESGQSISPETLKVKHTELKQLFKSKRYGGLPADPAIEKGVSLLKTAPLFTMTRLVLDGYQNEG